MSSPLRSLSSCVASRKRLNHGCKSSASSAFLLFFVIATCSPILSVVADECMTRCSLSCSSITDCNVDCGGYFCLCTCKIKTGFIVGVAIGVVAAIAACIACCCYCCKRRTVMIPAGQTVVMTSPQQMGQPQQQYYAPSPQQYNSQQPNYNQPPPQQQQQFHPSVYPTQTSPQGQYQPPQGVQYAQ